MGAEGSSRALDGQMFLVLPWPASKSLPASANWQSLAHSGHPEASADIRRSARLQQQQAQPSAPVF